MSRNSDISKDQLIKWLAENGINTPSSKEINQTEDALINFASAYALPPPPSLRETILGKISQLEDHKTKRQILDVQNLPLLEESSNWMDWADAIHGISPPEQYDNIHLHTLETNDKRELFVAWVKEFVPEEVHRDLLESFLLLEGSCECHITDESGHTRIVYMNTGDFITMKIGETHDICITSLHPAKAILQWLKIAA